MTLRDIVLQDVEVPPSRQLSFAEGATPAAMRKHKERVVRLLRLCKMSKPEKIIQEAWRLVRYEAGIPCVAGLVHFIESTDLVLGMCMARSYAFWRASPESAGISPAIRKRSPCRVTPSKPDANAESTRA